MPAALDVDREQVRMLVLAVGVREAARQMNLSVDAVMQWSARGKWLAHLRQPKPVLPLSMQSANVSNVSKPADALEKVLKERQNTTKLAQSAYLERASKKLQEVPDDVLLDHAPTGKTLAEMASKVYPEAPVDQSTHFAFFSVTCGRDDDPPEIPAIDVPGSVIEDDY